MLTVNRRATGKRIEKAIRSKGLTYKQTAELAEVSLGAISNWTTGYCLPSIDTMARLIQVLDCGFDDLICLSAGEKE